MSYEEGVAYIVDACRTAGGRKNGRISHWHPVDLGAQVLNGLVDRNNLDGSKVDDVIFGCVSQVGAQAGNIGRYCVLASKLPESVPGTAVDRQCGSSQQALHFAAQAVMSGVQDVVIAGGVESMSQVPMGASITDSMEAGRGTMMSPKILEKYGERSQMFSQFDGAEMVAQKFGISREEMDRLGVASQQRAAAATKEGRFKREIVPIEGIDKKTNTKVVHDADEGIRPTTAEAVAKLRTLRKDGRITAATSSQICDGAAAVLICNAAGLKKLGVRPMAKIVSLALAGTDPVMMLAGPIPATFKALNSAGLSINDMDVYEVNEAFASVPLAWAKECKADLAKLNVNGGAMALGHPLGGSGCKLMTTLVHELVRRGGRYGLQAICEGGGTANATIIERIPQSKM